MKISTKGRLATGSALATILLIGALFWWASDEVEDAYTQRGHTMQLSRALTELRLLSFEYVVYHQPRALLQQRAATQRVDRLIAAGKTSGLEERNVLKQVGERSQVVHRMFERLVDIVTLANANAYTAPDEATARLLAQLSSGLLILLHENQADSYRLINLSTERIYDAQQRGLMVVITGLTLVAICAIGAGWFINRTVLAPIGRLERATREVAAGNLDYQLDIDSQDEIGEVARSFNAMTHSLRVSFARVERSNQELAALNREIEAFSYSVSHDLRGPLRSMDGFSLAVLEDCGDKLDESSKDALQRIRAASQRMGRLIDELLGLSRVTRVDLTWTDVNLSKVATEIAQALDASAQGDAKADAQADEGAPGPAVQWVIAERLMLRGDLALVQIAMQNLLENACKFSAKSAAPCVHVGATQRDGETVFFVADNGVGFDMAYADRLFGAFQRLHHESEFAGTGIGLAIVQRIVRRHEGRIWAEAKPGLGATFFFNLKEPVHD